MPMRPHLYTFIVLDEVGNQKLYEFKATPEEALIKLKIALIGGGGHGRSNKKSSITKR